MKKYKIVLLSGDGIGPEISEGIQRGHMTLHARNLAVQAGANGSEIDLIVTGMIDSQNVTMDNALQILKGLR